MVPATVRLKPLNDVEAARLVSEYREGLTITGLARTCGIHRTTVQAHLDRAGVQRWGEVIDDDGTSPEVSN